jgi:tripartite-type tricarboxylate transporter receptor subunit TctC
MKHVAPLGPAIPARASLAALFLAAVLTSGAYGQTAAGPSVQTPVWPAKALHMIVPFPPGSSPDLVARMLNDRLGAALGHPVVVENRPGAGGNLGTNLIAKATPDGYTFGLSIGGPLAVNKVLYSKLEYDPFKDLAPITLVAASPNVLVVDPKLGVNSVKDLVALAKSQPGKLNYGSVGNGSASHLTMELLKTRAGIDIVHVPYPGSPQVNTAIVSGQIAAGFVVPATAMPLVQGGRLRAIAVTSSVRSPVLPELPTVAEAGYPGFQSTAWIGMAAPAKTPQPVIERLSSELVRIIRSDDVRRRMQSIYFQAIGTTPAGLAHLMREEVEQWGKVIKQTGAKAD